MYTSNSHVSSLNIFKFIFVYHERGKLFTEFYTHWMCIFESFVCFYFSIIFSSLNAQIKKENFSFREIGSIVCKTMCTCNCKKIIIHVLVILQTSSYCICVNSDYNLISRSISQMFI